MKNIGLLLCFLLLPLSPLLGQGNFIQETSPPYSDLLGQIMSYHSQKEPTNGNELSQAANDLSTMMSSYSSFPEGSYEEFMSKVYEAYVLFAKGLGQNNASLLGQAAGKAELVLNHPQASVDHKFKLQILKAFSNLYQLKFRGNVNDRNFYALLKKINDINPQESDLIDYKKSNVKYLAYTGGFYFVLKGMLENDVKLIKRIDDQLKRGFSLSNDPLDAYYKTLFRYIKLSLLLKDNITFSQCFLSSPDSVVSQLEQFSAEIDQVLNNVENPAYKDQLLMQRMMLDLFSSCLKDKLAKKENMDIYEGLISDESLKSQISILRSLVAALIALETNENINFNQVNKEEFKFWSGFYNFFRYVITDGQNTNARDYAFKEFDKVKTKELDDLFNVNLEFNKAFIKAGRKSPMDLNFNEKQLLLLNGFQKQYYYAIRAMYRLSKLPANHLVNQVSSASASQLGMLNDTYISQLKSYFANNVMNVFSGNEEEKLSQAFSFINLLALKEEQVLAYAAASAFSDKFSGKNKEKMKVVYAYASYLARSKYGASFNLGSLPKPIDFLNQNALSEGNPYYADYLFALMKLKQQKGEVNEAIQLGERLCRDMGDVRGCYNLAAIYEAQGQSANLQDCYDRIVTYCERNKEYGCDCKIYNRVDGSVKGGVYVDRKFNNEGLNIADLQYLFSLSVPFSNTAKNLLIVNGYLPEFFIHEIPFIGFNSMIKLTLNFSVTPVNVSIKDLNSGDELFNETVNSVSFDADIMASQKYLLNLRADENSFYLDSRIIKYTKNQSVNIRFVKKKKLAAGPDGKIDFNYRPVDLAVQDGEYSYVEFKPGKSFILKHRGKEINLHGKLTLPKLIFLNEDKVYVYGKAQNALLAFDASGNKVDDELTGAFASANFSELTCVKKIKNNLFFLSKSGQVLEYSLKDQTKKTGLVKCTDILSADFYDDKVFYINKKDGKLYFASPYREDPREFFEDSDLASQLSLPTCLSITEEGLIMITDPVKNKIFVFNQVGYLVDHFEMAADGRFSRMALDDKKVYLINKERFAEYELSGKGGK